MDGERAICEKNGRCIEDTHTHTHTCRTFLGQMFPQAHDFAWAVENGPVHTRGETGTDTETEKTETMVTGKRKERGTEEAEVKKVNAQHNKHTAVLDLATHGGRVEEKGQASGNASDGEVRKARDSFSLIFFCS